MAVFDWSLNASERSEFFALCNQIFETAYLTNHEIVQKFEKEFALFCKADDTVAVSSGTAALEILFRSINIKNKKVLLPVNTFIATAGAVVAAGGVPVPVDIDLDTLAPRLESLQQEKTKDTAAVVLVHLGGLITPEIKAIYEWCRREKIYLFEDAAHAHGSFYEGKSAGLLSDGGAFSFHLTKTMTMGEGGALVSAEPLMLKKARSLRRLGMTEENPLLHQEWSGNYKLTEMQAALGLVELKRAQTRIQKRQKLAKIYQSRLAGLAGAKAYGESPQSTCGYYKQIVFSEIPRAKFETALLAENIHLTGGVYYFPLNRQPVMREFVATKKFPLGDRFADHHFCPPCYPELSEDDVHRVCDVIEKVAKS